MLQLLTAICLSLREGKDEEFNGCASEQTTGLWYISHSMKKIVSRSSMPYENQIYLPKMCKLLIVVLNCIVFEKEAPMHVAHADCSIRNMHRRCINHSAARLLGRDHGACLKKRYE